MPWATRERLSTIAQLLLLTLAALGGAYGRTALGPLQESMRLALSLSDNQMALLQGPALAAPLAITAIPLGLMIDRLNRVRLLFVLTLVGVAGSALTAASSNFGLLFVARALAGMAGFAVNPVCFSLVADLYAPAQRGRATMVLTVGQFAGKSAAFAVGGALLALAPDPGGAWRWAMGWQIAPIAAIALLLLAMREPVRVGVTQTAPPLSAAWPEFLRHRRVIGPILVGVMLIEIALGGALVWSAPMLQRTFGLPPQEVGGILATALLFGGLLGPVAGGLLADLCHKSGGPHRTMVVVAILAAFSAAAAAFPLVPHPGAASVLLIVFMTMVFAVVVMAVTLFTLVVPAPIRGFCQAVLAGAAVIASSGLAPLAVSLLSGTLGGEARIGDALALVCVITSLSAAVIFMLFRRAYAPAGEISQ